MIFVAVFMALSLATRITLLIKANGDVSWTTGLFRAFSWGTLFDFGAACLFSIPIAIALAFIPSKWGSKRWHHIVTHVTAFAALYGLAFIIIAEWLFWDEFGARFNFIAVDYLIYTTEVIGNIRESYSMSLVFGGVAAIAAIIHFAIWKTGLPSLWLAGKQSTNASRFRDLFVCLAIATVVTFGLSEERLPDFKDNYQHELAKNGPWAFCAAFRANELDYARFYPTIPEKDAYAALAVEFVEDGSKIVCCDEGGVIRRFTNPGPEKHPNVIQITVESLSAEFLGSFNPKSKLTPNLDALVKDCLVATNLYATGTRTDRGMEALTLSLPPTPGRSIIKRPHNEGMATLGSLFRIRGYDTAFIYGGYGYFDNMNYFFGNNGYRVVDRTALPKEDVTFGNVWGACDEDLFRWTIREADTAYAAGKPFFHFVMTTSNHRPYTFPEGRIDLPSKVSGRAGGVKYSDYAIGCLIREAAKRPWFKDTVFVIVADHCASSAGKEELPINKYHIPMLIYAPGGQIAPGKINTRMSQIDYAPTLLGLLGWSYDARFFGYDIAGLGKEPGHALIGNYQKLALLEDSHFAVLKPVRRHSMYDYDQATNTTTPKPDDKQLLTDTIAYYQSASHFFKHGLMKELPAPQPTGTK